MSDGAGLERRIEELEIRLAFQERLLQDLDDVLRTLRDEIDALRAAHRDLAETVMPAQGEVVDEKPPHW